MSNWTHVAGIIRMDSIRGFASEPNFDELIGKEVRFEDEVKVWDDAEENPDKYLPIGSEGSLEKSVWINPDESHCAAYVISIFGDLRSHDSAEEIVEWFKNKVTKIEEGEFGWVRQAVITVWNEFSHKNISWQFAKEEE